MVFPGGYIGICSASSLAGPPPLRQYRLSVCLLRGRSFTAVPPGGVDDCTVGQFVLRQSTDVMIVFH